ncbi:hypothetical protein EC957_012303 [Mortierella hygrophila]|uniref:Uncharacterized protein n=1 Tax=Mortierella hygrophila TaxID=979708 RepID=A0A9P6F7R7_9FUNG|nr:hypothetical protein EC957_012303 [Mortierella hygrophila]
MQTGLPDSLEKYQSDLLDILKPRDNRIQNALRPQRNYCDPNIKTLLEPDEEVRIIGPMVEIPEVKKQRLK